MSTQVVTRKATGPSSEKRAVGSGGPGAPTASFDLPATFSLDASLKHHGKRHCIARRDSSSMEMLLLQGAKKGNWLPGKGAVFTTSQKRVLFSPMSSFPSVPTECTDLQIPGAGSA